MLRRKIFVHAACLLFCQLSATAEGPPSNIAVTYTGAYWELKNQPLRLEKFPNAPSMTWLENGPAQLSQLSFRPSFPSGSGDGTRAKFKPLPVIICDGYAYQKSSEAGPLRTTQGIDYVHREPQTGGKTARQITAQVVSWSCEVCYVRVKKSAQVTTVLSQASLSPDAAFETETKRWKELLGSLTSKQN